MINFDQTMYGVLATIASAAGAVLIALLPKAKSYVEEKIQAVKNDSVRAALDQALDILTNVVETVVSSLEQTTVGVLKAEANGQLTAENAQLVKNKAITQIKAVISAEMLQLLQSQFGDLDTYISHLIENTVFNIKSASVAGNKAAEPAAK